MRSQRLTRIKFAFFIVTFGLLIIFAFTGDPTKPLPPRTQPVAERNEARRAGTGPDRIARIDPNVPVPPLQNKPDITLPYIELWPNAVSVGDTVAVRGMNFCATAVCGALTIRVDDKIILDNVTVTDDGRFVAYLTVGNSPGLQHIAAEQHDTSGQTLRDSKVLPVARLGQGSEEEETPPQTTLTVTPGPIVARPNYRPQASLTMTTPIKLESPGAIGFQPNVSWGGRSVAVDVAPNNGDEAIAAAESGGLFRTTDQGVTWTHLDNLPAFRMFDVKYASADGNIVIATSAVNSRTANDGGIWRSTDHGLTWSKPATSNPPCADRVNAYGIAVVWAFNEVYVGTECGLAISHDQGATWTHVANWNPGGTPRVFGVAAGSYGRASSVVDLCGDFGHRRSTDSGATWTTTNSLPEPYAACPGLGVHAITQSPIDQNVVFITKYDGPITCGTDSVYRAAVYESDNGGSSWFRRYLDCGASRTPSILADSTAATGQIVVYFSDGLSLYQQVCSGAAPNPRCGTTWTYVSVSHSDINGMAVSPAVYCPMYVVSDGGIHKTSDCGATFPIAGAGNGGYQALQIYEVQDQVHPGLPTDLYFGTQDNSLWSSVDSGATWGAAGPEGFFISLQHNTPTNMGQKINFVACWPCNNNQSGPGWANPVPQYWNNPPGVGGFPAIVEPNVYFQFTQVNPPTDTTALLYLTLNNGLSWTAVPGVAINEPIWTMPLISGPTYNPTIYIGVQNAGGAMGLRKITHVRGPGNAAVTAADTGLSNIGLFVLGQGAWVYPMVVGVDPSNPDHAIAADVGTSQMKVTTNGGSSWVVMPELTNLVTDNGKYDFARWGVDGIGGMVQPHFIQWDPANTNRILVSTDEAGVLYSQNGGQSWGRLTGSQKITNGSNFAFDEVLGRTLAASYGRGLWQLDFTPADLNIAQSGPASIIGSQIHYVITVTNTGPLMAENTSLTDQIPQNTTFAALQPPPGGGWTCTTPAVGATGTISCNGGDRASGNVSVFALTLNVNANVIEGLGICNTAHARSDVIDTTPGNDATACGTRLDALVVDRSDNANVTDCSSGSNDCTLRGAINKLNSYNTNHATIRFDPAISQISIGSSLPTITARGTTISGTLGSPRLDGAGMPGGDVISIYADEVTINGLSIVNAPAGAADIFVGTGLGIQLTNNYLGTLPESAGATNCTPAGVSRNGTYGVYADINVNGTSNNPALWLTGNRVACHSVAGVYLAGADGAIVRDNYIGTNSNGATLPNGVGVGLVANGARGASYHTVANNIIANNGQTGIRLLGMNTNDANSTSGNVITGNVIVHNGQIGGLGGVYLSNGSFLNTLGGASASDANIIEGNVGNGISVIDSNANGILGNFIGNAHGYGNNTGHGVYIGNGAANMIGGFLLLRRSNVIGGNNQDGVQLYGSGTTQNSVISNTIGLNVTTTATLSNNWSGVAVFGSASNNSVAGNVIAGNGTGVYISGAGTQHNVVSGNAIGTNWSSASGLGNTNQGVWVRDGAASNTIGLTSSNGSNLISGNGGPGVLIDGSGTTDNTVQGNKIGTNTSGTAALPNHDGVQVYSLAASTLITANLISGNSGNGVALNNASNTMIEANWIGLNASGTTPIANTGHGLSVEASTDTYIGQISDHSAPQFISGNGQHGIYIASSTNNWIGWFNHIGYGGNSTTPMGNAWAGVMLSGTQNSTLNATIGYNGHEGIGVVGEASLNEFLLLRIEGNGDIPIDLGDDGPTLNGSHPTGTGPNGWINYPVITATQGHVITGTACANCTVIINRALGTAGGAQWADGAYANASGIWTRTLSNDLYTSGIFLQACQPDCVALGNWFANSSEFSPIYRFATKTYLPIILHNYNNPIVPPITPTPSGRPN